MKQKSVQDYIKTLSEHYYPKYCYHDKDFDENPYYHPLLNGRKNPIF